jgi:hypothetical protein
MLKFSISVVAAVAVFSGLSANQGADWLPLRERLSVPKYGLEKIEPIVKKLMEARIPRELDERVYNSLQPYEKLTYCMLYGESYHQVCMLMGLPKDASRYVFQSPPSPFYKMRIGQAWSRRQRDFFTKNREVVIQGARESLQRDRWLGANFKHALLYVKASEIMPDLVLAYKADKRDRDVLSLMMLLMQAAVYKPFSETKVAKDLYGHYSEGILFTSEVEATILLQANNFIAEMTDKG